MPEFSWKGPGEMEETTLSRGRAPEIQEPTKADVTGNKTKLYACKVPSCNARFKKSMIHARHFNTTHEDLKVDKDTWRNYIEEVWV